MTTAPMNQANVSNLSPEQFREASTAVENEVGKVIVGQRLLIRQTLITLLAGGNALLEGVPGLAKTTLVRTLADVIDCRFSRIQFTPDLMPADIVGTTIIAEDETGRKAFRFEPGPIFSNLVLADEINRATPKTQSALLEAMQERTVTVAKTIHKLDRPFFVLATQNPLEMEGTYPLPEAQLDRFFFKIDVPFPSVDELVEIANRTTGVNTPTPRRIINGAMLVQMQALAREVPIASHVLHFAARLVAATHPNTREAAPVAKQYRALWCIAARHANVDPGWQDHRAAGRALQRRLRRPTRRRLARTASSHHPELRGTGRGYDRRRRYAWHPGARPRRCTVAIMSNQSAPAQAEALFDAAFLRNSTGSR